MSTLYIWNSYMHKHTYTLRTWNACYTTWLIIKNENPQFSQKFITTTISDNLMEHLLELGRQTPFKKMLIKLHLKINYEFYGYQQESI